MSFALKRILPQEYLVRERQSSTKSEYYQGEVFAMGGGSANHSLIAANFVGEARNALKDKPCIVFNSDLRVQVQSTGLYTSPMRPSCVVNWSLPMISAIRWSIPP